MGERVSADWSPSERVDLEKALGSAASTEAPTGAIEVEGKSDGGRAINDFRYEGPALLIRTTKSALRSASFLRGDRQVCRLVSTEPQQLGFGHLASQHLRGCV